MNVSFEVALEMFSRAKTDEEWDEAMLLVAMAYARERMVFREIDPEGGT